MCLYFKQGKSLFKKIPLYLKEIIRDLLDSSLCLELNYYHVTFWNDPGSHNSVLNQIVL